MDCPGQRGAGLNRYSGVSCQIQPVDQDSVLCHYFGISEDHNVFGGLVLVAEIGILMCAGQFSAFFRAIE